MKSGAENGRSWAGESFPFPPTATSCADPRLPGQWLRGCGLWLPHRDTGSMVPTPTSMELTWVFGQPGSRAPLEGAPGGLHNFKTRRPGSQPGAWRPFSSQPEPNRNLRVTTQFPDQVASTHSHLCFFEGSRFKRRGKKSSNGEKRVSKHIPSGPCVCMRASLGPGIPAQRLRPSRSRGRQAPSLQGTESPNRIRPSRTDGSSKPFFQKFASLSRQCASFSRCGRVLISRLRGVQHREPQVLHAFEPPTPPKTSVRSFGTPRNSVLLYHGVAGTRVNPTLKCLH